MADADQPANTMAISALPDDQSPPGEIAGRDLFNDRLEMALLRWSRFPDRRFAVLSLDVEQLSSIEAALGDEAGRDVRTEFAQRLKTAVRNYDTIGYIAGNQFGIVLESVRDESDPARVANRVHESLRTPIVTIRGQFMVTANIGIVLSGKDVGSAGRMLQLAGLARIRAREGASVYEIYDTAMHEHATQRLQKEMELRRAIEERQFELHYQPIISLANGRIVQTEALIRWRHPDRGLVPAADFIALAEETGVAIPMGWFTLNRACRQLSEWRERPGSNENLSMSINLTAAHFRQRNVTEQVGDVLSATGISHGLNFEITERILIGDHVQACAVLGSLRELGVRIHLDDFGTGYSSLQYLHELPFDAIKIDRGFIGRMRNGGRDAQVVTTIRELARQLGVPVIAEGVESAEHLRLVRELGCEYAQGYHFARPLPADATADLMASQPQW
jgi:diguanylate cyclase (GGDEF)-like protein